MKHANGIWIWYLGKIRPDYIDKLRRIGCKRIYLKVFDDKSNPMLWDFQCNREIISAFNEAGIEVFGWGYHFDQRIRIDVQTEADAVLEAIGYGLSGYVIDVEHEVKDKRTHGPLEELLKELKARMPESVPLGYTSYGHPGKHPNVPWKILDNYCNLAFPQIYYEKFTFGRTDQAEVTACIEAHSKLGLELPLLPIWGSEEDTKNPATRDSLQYFLNANPGSSVFRAPNVGQKGEAWNLDYSGQFRLVDSDMEQLPVLHAFGRTPTAAQLSDVKMFMLQGLPRQNHRDDEADLETIVRSYQLKNGLSPDGLLDVATYSSLSAPVPTLHVFSSERRGNLASFAELEAARALRWTDKDCEAEKYLEPFRKPMMDRGQIGKKIVFYDWCAAFVTYCCRSCGYDIPDSPDNFYATMALVESWKHWAKTNGTWLEPKNTTLERGDIVCFEWYDGDASADHIAIVRNYSGDSTRFETSEGNRKNQSGNYADRKLANVAGIIRLRD